jgi:hypothetical protein
MERIEYHCDVVLIETAAAIRPIGSKESHDPSEVFLIDRLAIEIASSKLGTHDPYPQGPFER